MLAKVRQAAVTRESQIGELGEEAALGALGLVEVKLTKREELILNEPAPIGDVLIKPTGQPYLSHPSYTRWFNRAFGRLGWGVVMRGKPRSSTTEGGKVQVVAPYVLYIHGRPAAFAFGEQEYFESNKEQTYGDALEATVASALRRCAKRLGVGLELWDKPWLNAFMAQHCVKVKLKPKKPDEKPSYVWRRRVDPPFWNEEGSVQQQRTAAPAAGHDGRGDEFITQTRKDDKGVKHAGQVERLWVIIRNSGRDPEAVRTWLHDVYGVDSTRKIKQRDYEAICAAIESPNPFLPKKAELVEREPGEEG
jgi:hypothetical protein